jgi:hypothetical protein
MPSFLLEYWFPVSQRVEGIEDSNSITYSSSVAGSGAIISTNAAPVSSVASGTFVRFGWMPRNVIQLALQLRDWL